MIDDDPAIHRLVKARLRAEGFETHGLSEGVSAVSVAQELKPDVILLDVDLPRVSGFDLCRELKENPATMLIPIIFLTGMARTEDKVRGLDLGATDYVMKPFDSVELCARVRSAVRTKYLLDLLDEKAQIDGLTGLNNRAHFDRRLPEEMQRSDRYGSPVALIMCDIDNFKQINDVNGHFFGDRVLQEVAMAIREQARSVDIVARYGGEEFAIILPQQDCSQAAIVAERIREEIARRRFNRSGRDTYVTVSFGVACHAPKAVVSPGNLIQAADRALYSAKEAGRNRVHCWNGRKCVPFEPNPADDVASS